MQRTADGSYVYSASDLMHFLGCRHSVYLDLKNFSDQLTKDSASESDLLLRQKGIEHEKAYLQTLRDAGGTVAEIPPDTNKQRRRDLTLRAMESGADVVYQAALADSCWAGDADFLIRTETPSQLGDFSYEVVDTKLSRHADVSHVVQIGVYSRMLAAVQGTVPVRCHLVLGNGTRESFQVNHFAAYVRYAQQQFEQFVAVPPATSYPEPCQHCTSCHWQSHCTSRWQEDDHLSLVAGMQAPHARKLIEAGVPTLAGLAAMSEGVSVLGMNPDVLKRLRGQAALQLRKRQSGQDCHELLPAAPGKGFERLPAPDAHDLYFDMEGDPLQQDGLEYLFGLYYLDGCEPVFRPFWAHDAAQECAAFRQLMDFLSQHIAAHPGAYIYHYNHYEPTALKKLSCRHAIAEQELDQLLRQERFVDLYKVVREGVRVSEASYSIKNMEVFYMKKRDGAVATAGDSIVVYNRWRQTGDDRLLDEIASYNRVDCESTKGLRDWLLKLRPEGSPWFTGSGNAGEAPADMRSDKTREREERYTAYRERLETECPSAPALSQRVSELLGFYTREAKPQWWAVFDRCDRFDDELIDDAECLAGLSLIGPPEKEKQSFVYTYSFPSQETKLRAGDGAKDVRTRSYAGTIVDLDEKNCVVKVKRGTKSGPLPEQLHLGPGDPLPTDKQEAALYRFADELLAGTNGYPAIRALLNRDLPRVKGRIAGEPLLQGDDVLAGVTEAVAGLDNSYLFIQGPPGAGKTYTTAHVIVELIRRGKRVGVAANSHKAIHNVIDRVEELALERGIAFSGVKKSSGGDSEYEGRFIHSERDASRIPSSAQLLAGTAWFFPDPQFDRQLDFLFIDEAGQVALANVVAMGTAARNFVLIGDQMQLGQPTQGVHPGESGLSVLDFLLSGEQVVSSDRGVFLGVTRRLRPEICDFISEAFYEGRLTPHPDNSLCELVFDPNGEGMRRAGVHFRQVAHAGCSQKSEPEGEVIGQLYGRLLTQKFRDKDGSVRTLGLDDILVVTPYNVQVNYLRSILPENARVGTVDKFQGQEAPVVCVSMVTSSADEMPRDLDFLFSANRLNVAVSRAQCLAVVVANPLLLETPCRTVPQIRLLNNFCLLLEYARRAANSLVQ